MVEGPAPAAEQGQGGTYHNSSIAPAAGTAKHVVVSKNIDVAHSYEHVRAGVNLCLRIEGNNLFVVLNGKQDGSFQARWLLNTNNITDSKKPYTFETEEHKVTIKQRSGGLEIEAKTKGWRSAISRFTGFGDPCDVQIDYSLTLGQSYNSEGLMIEIYSFMDDEKNAGGRFKISEGKLISCDYNKILR